ncbi:MAG TPA: hypothetical protein VHS03_15950 [Gaiellaceae bacterium]|nr:hypothetical protein [Gaiellaceae bacterium]
MLLSLLGYVRDVMGNQANSDVRPLIHPQAEMRLLVSLGRPLRGRARVVDALESGRSAVLFRAGDIAFEWLDMTSVLGFGHARYAREDGEIVERDVCWLCEFKDGLVWRVQAFDTEKAARQAYAGPRPAD